MNADQLRSGLAALKRRILVVGGVTVGGWALLAAVLTLLVCMWLDLVLDLSSGLRALCGAAAMGLALVIVARLGLRLRRGTADDRLGERLDAAVGGRGQVVSGVDLLMNPAAARAGGATTLSLAQIAIDRAAALAWGMSTAAAVPARPVFRPFLLFAMVLAFIGIAALTVPRLVGTQLARFFDPYGDHPPYSRITFDVAPGNTKVVYGSALDVRAVAGGDVVESAELVLETAAGGAKPEPLPMFPETGGAWRATVANVTIPGRYYVRAQGARSKRFDVGVITVPKLEAVRFRITPPAYTNRPPYEGPLPQGGIAGLIGTKVEMWAKSNRPLSRGSLTFTPDATSKATTQAATPNADARPQPMAPVAPNASEVAGSFVIARAGKVDLDVTDVEGQPSSPRAFSASVSVLPDERPFVRMMQPPDSSFATPDVTIPVETVGEDDYGVSRVAVYRSLNDSRAIPKDTAAPKPEPTRFPTTTGLPLASYGLKPGDVLKLYARVEDNDPAGAKGSESPVVTIQIISAEQMRRMQLTQQGLEVLTSKYEEAARRMEALDAEMERLRKELEKQPDGQPVSAELKKQMEELAKRAAEEAAAVRESAKDLLPYDIDKNLTPQLDNAAKKLDEAAKGLGEMCKGEPGVGSAKGALDEVRKKLGAQRKDFKEQASEPLRHLELIFPLKEDEARFIELYQRQRDLEQRLHSLSQEPGVSDDPKKKARMRDLEAEQRGLREALGELAEDIEGHVAALPDDPQLAKLRKTATEFVDALRKSGATEKMADAELALTDFQGAQAHADAKAAADIMEKLLSKCKGGMGEEAGKCLVGFSPSLASNLGNTVEQLLQGMGMGSNPGNSMGNGAGYSARRSTMQNVGLYGGRPTRASWAKSGGGRKSGPGGAGDGEGAAAGDPDDPARFGEQGKLRATGQSDSVVPPQYRRRVGDYFQRVADEIGE